MLPTFWTDRLGILITCHCFAGKHRKKGSSY